MSNERATLLRTNSGRQRIMRRPIQLAVRNDEKSRELLGDVMIVDGGAILNIPRPTFAVPVKVLTGGDEDWSNLEVLRSSLSEHKRMLRS